VSSAAAFGGSTAGSAIARERSGTDFDPSLVNQLLSLAERPTFWTLPEASEVQLDVLSMKPASDFDGLSPDQCDSVCELLADFADVKSRQTWNHSLMVAEQAKLSDQLGFDQESGRQVRRAALVHDLGQAAVPVGILDKLPGLSPEEEGRFRTHPLYTEQVLRRVSTLSALADDAAAHHERLDGSGFPRGLSGSAVLPAARIQQRMPSLICAEKPASAPTKR
jgi:HD-GYP domain-containing protein (c-di-GMP phosphodiesterase class II)